MKKVIVFTRKILTGFCMLSATMSVAQNITISGYVKDARSKESLIGVNILADKGTGTTTNAYGYYSLTVPANDSVVIRVSYISYEPQSFLIKNKKSQRLDILLEPKATQLEEVVISANKTDENVNNPETGVMKIPIKTIDMLPVLAGEKDILKTIQFLPGVQQGQEGTTGFYVRGGNTDQNMVQLDEATIYNPNHLFGLFSSFNINAVKSMRIIKGGFPADFGGRLSSLVDITMKDGNKEQFEEEGGIGVLTTNLTLQGPIEKGKSSFIISGRRSFLDLIFKPFYPNGFNGMNYYFYDFNMKLNYELNKNNHLFVSFFRGNDVASYIGANSLNFNTDFGNKTSTVRWNHLYGDKLFSNMSFVFNDYHLALATTQGNYYSALFTGVRDFTVKSDFTYLSSPNHTTKAGLVYTYHTITPGVLSAKVPRNGNLQNISPDSLLQYYSSDAAAYINDEVKMTNAISASYGLRFPVYYSRSKTYTAVEPRLTVKFSLGPNTSIKASYVEVNQFIHLVPNSTASLPTDIWLTSSPKIKPQKSTQYVAGIFKNFKDNTIETSVEAYYKTMKNEVLFKEGTQITLGSNIEDFLVFGDGTSYGIEFFVKKNFGKLTGWASYTLSKTTELFPDLNFGKEFPFTYDRRHNFSVAAVYALSKTWTISAAFTYYSGMAFTIPSGRVYVFNDGSLYDGIYYDYSGRNNARLKPYNRLDLSISNKKETKIFGKKYEREWVFGVYNAYNRQNPYFVYLTVDYYSHQPQAKQVSLLPVIPSISFNFKF